MTGAEERNNTHVNICFGSGVVESEEGSIFSPFAHYIHNSNGMGPRRYRQVSPHMPASLHFGRIRAFGALCVGFDVSIVEFVNQTGFQRPAKHSGKFWAFSHFHRCQQIITCAAWADPFYPCVGVKRHCDVVVCCCYSSLVSKLK